MADEFLDLVALGNCGDMMSLRSFETRYLITKGFKKENIKNPFIDYMLDKNSFPLSKADYVSSDSSMSCTSIGAAFFIVPFPKNSVKVTVFVPLLSSVYSFDSSN